MDNLPVIAIRFALYADLMVLAGVTAFSLYALKPEERGTALLPPVSYTHLTLPTNREV